MSGIACLEHGYSFRYDLEIIETKSGLWSQLSRTVLLVSLVGYTCNLKLVCTSRYHTNIQDTNIYRSTKQKLNQFLILDLILDKCTC